MCFDSLTVRLLLWAQVCKVCGWMTTNEKAEEKKTTLCLNRCLLKYALKYLRFYDLGGGDDINGN